MAESDATLTPPETGDDATRIVVLLPLGLDTAYDYLVPAGESAPVGAFVRVPLGSREVTGVVWRTVEVDDDAGLTRDRLKYISAVLPVPALPESVRKLVDWVAEYTLAKRGAVLRMAMSVPAALEPAKMRLAYLAGEDFPERLTPARKRVLDLLADGMPRGAMEVAREAAVSAGVVRGLADSGALRQVSLPAWQAPERPDWRLPRATLSADQRVAADSLVARVRESEFSVTLLDGVTGGLFRGCGGGVGSGAPGAGDAAGDLPRHAMAGTLPRALRHCAGGVAFGTRPARAPRNVARRGGRHRTCRRRRALGAVATVRRTWPDGGGRGA